MLVTSLVEKAHLVPSVPPRYKILQEVGRGGMYIVYKAEDLKLHRIVALKFLPENLTALGDDMARFQREPEAISVLNHPNIATIHDIDEVDGRKFFTLEFISGGTLKSKVRELLSTFALWFLSHKRSHARMGVDQNSGTINARLR